MLTTANPYRGAMGGKQTLPMSLLNGEIQRQQQMICIQLWCSVID